MSTLTLTCNGITLALPGDLLWADEYDWHPVQQSKTYTTTGALVLDVGVRQAGRPLTLNGADNAAWLTREQCETLRAWAALPAPAMTLELRGEVRAVAFDHDRTAFEARPVFQVADGDEEAADWYVPTLRLIEL
ncbi:MAG: hypothetical protein IAE92_02485 [Burkholderiaceae bacterium]|nr:hypothetical protein [Burkholderiaceae bacterium]